MGPERLEEDGCRAELSPTSFIGCFNRQILWSLQGTTDREESTMICSVCYRMLRGQEGRHWRGTFDLHFAHHRSKSSLIMSADMGCCFCSALWNEILQLPNSDTSPKTPGHFITAFLCGIGAHTPTLGQPHAAANHSVATTEDYVRRLASVQLHGTASSLHDFLRLFRLDFKLNDTRRLGSFLLRPVGEYIRPARLQWRLRAHLPFCRSQQGVSTVQPRIKAHGRK